MSTEQPERKGDVCGQEIKKADSHARGGLGYGCQIQEEAGGLGEAHALMGASREKGDGRETPPCNLGRKANLSRCWEN